MSCRGWAVAGLVGLAACGGPPPAVPPTPSRGGPAWTELASEHFTVWTDSSPEQGNALVETMERLRQVVLGVSFFKSDSRARSFVIAFRNMEEVHAYLPPQFIAHAWSTPNLLGQPVIVLSTASLADDPRIVTHELTHVIAFNVIPRQPAWLAEGLAGYFETVRIDDNKLELGRPLEFRIRQIRAHGLVPVANLFACREPACMTDSFYASTWALVSFLINEHPAEFAHYLTLLRVVQGEDQQAAWSEAFPALSPAVLDAELARWAGHGKTKINQYTVAFKPVSSKQRVLADVDALSARGLLRAFFARTVVPDEITQALALDATAVLPNVVASATTAFGDAAKARAVATAHPDDWRSWWLVARATRGTEESHDALVKMCERLEQNPAAISPELCAPERLDPSKDPRREVFHAAEPQVNACFAVGKTRLGRQRSLVIEIGPTGTVTDARASVGSPEAEACIVGVLRTLKFPPGYSGTFTVGSR